MALPTASDNQFPKVIMEEVASDGSATVTPAADHRALFLGEDGLLHVKDSAAAVTNPYATGAISHSYIGYNTVGGSTEVMTSTRYYLKKVTLAASGLITSVGAYLKQGTSGSTPYIAMGVWEDNAGTPRYLIAASGYSKTLLQHNSGAAGDARWYHQPMGLYLTAADYWIGVACESTGTTAYTIYYDGSGSDKYYTTGSTSAGNDWETDAGYYTINTSSNKYSIRASLIT